MNENYKHFIVEYMGDFDEQIKKIDYACGSSITDTLGVISVKDEDVQRLRKDVPSIIFIEGRSIYTLQEIENSQGIDPSTTGEIGSVKINPYLHLTGRGVLVGMVDSGINYLNEEFIREDDTSRILEIWDQGIQSNSKSYFNMGTVYSNEEINKAIKAHKSGGNPHSIVPSIDEIDHGTKMAGIIGARGYNGKMQGVANDCDFLVVKLAQSLNYKKTLRENNLTEVPVYNGTEILSAIEYLRYTARKLNKPLVIYLGLGTTEGSHDGNNMISRFITSLASKEGVVFIAGTGNEWDNEGHVLNYIKNDGEISTAELNIGKDMKTLEFTIWVQKPDRMALNVIAPSGEELDFISPKIYSMENKNYYFINTNLKVYCYDPENFTGHQIFNLVFTDIKKGIWKIQLKGEYISSGRYNIWLPSKSLLPEGTKFLNSNPINTLMVPSTARKVTTIGYYNEIKNTIESASGRGFNTNYLVNPDIVANGIDILTTSGEDNKVVKVSGSSAATAIVAGSICLLIQWQVIDKKYTGLYSTKLRSILIYSAKREPMYDYPNESLGYGKLDLLDVFYVLGGEYRGIDNYKEYYVNNLFIRCPINQLYKKEVNN
ncbi:S8 family peptidase [Clostridium sp.]|uniref:S8 family peptidase n=1 Tax=Clostridium sp. TaxID=1506 RepID=UPI003F389190